MKGIYQTSEIGTRLSFSGIGPEDERNMLAQLGRSKVQDEISQQGFQPGRLQTLHWLIIVADLKGAKQLNIQHASYVSVDTEKDIDGDI